MIEIAWNIVHRLLGLEVDATDLSFGHMAWRSIIVFSVAVFLARVGDRRMLGHNAGFDIVLLVILGSVLSRGINGQAAFLPTLGASALLVGFHHLAAALAFRHHWFSKMLKGSPRTLVRDGVPDLAALKRSLITADDLDENIRLHGNVPSTKSVAEARLERNGVISVIKSKSAQ